MNITVKTSKCDLKYEVNEDIKIIFLKGMIQLFTNILVQNFSLTYNNEILENDKTLREYKIKNGACLILSPSNVESQPSLLPGSNIRTLLSRLKALT